MLVWIGGGHAEDARAASVADSVKGHVEENLEKKPPPKKRPVRRPRAAPRVSTAPGSSPQGSEPVTPPEPTPTAPRSKVPMRVIGPGLLLDPRFEVGYRGWLLQQYPSVDVSAQGYFTWSVELKAKIGKFLRVHRGYYESNALSAPRHSGAVVAAQVGEQVPKAAWILGMIGFPITKAWEPVIRYEARAFQTSATPSRPVLILPHDTPASTDLALLTPTTERLTMVSGFETLVIGVQYNHKNDSSATIDPNAGPLPPFYFGIGLIQYRKPYQVTVGDATLDDVLFDARFRGAGLAGGLELPAKPDNVIFQAAAQLGLGEVRLLEDLTLNELLPQAQSRSGLTPPEWMIGYLQGDVTIGYLYPLLRTKPSVLVSAAANGGGATFFYFKTQREEGEPASAPPLNWDFLWGVRVAITVPL